MLSVSFVLAGANHFFSPGLYLSIMPPYLPRPLALVYLSGLFEVLGGLGVLVPRFRKAAGWGLIALLVAVFPANLYMATASEQFTSQGVPLWILYARLPLQLGLIAWAYWVTQNSPIKGVAGS